MKHITLTPAPLLTHAEIDKLTVEKPFDDRCASALKWAFVTPVCIGIGGLALPLGVFILVTKPFSGGSGAAAAFGNFAGMSMAVGSVVAGVAVYGILIFGGPLALPILGGVLATSSLVGGVLGFRSKIDWSATRDLQRPYRDRRNAADALARKEKGVTEEYPAVAAPTPWAGVAARLRR
jgi:hypothetical protein